MKQVIPINAIKEGDIAPAITAHYHKAGGNDFTPHERNHIPHLAVLEIEMNEPKIQIVATIDSGIGDWPTRQDDKIYSLDGISPTIAIARSNHAPKIMQIGSYSPSSSCNAKVLDTDGICPTLLDHKGAEPAIIKHPHEYFPDGMTRIAPCILGYTRDNKGNVQNYHEREIAGTLHTSSGQGGNTDQFVKEPCGLYDNQRGDFARKPIFGLARTLKADNHNAVLTHYRIRKLTPTECLRLMGVDDTDIEKMKSAKLTQTLKNGKVKERPMPKTQLYKMAGNSIVVDVLYHIFYQMFIAEPPKPQPKQLSLFDL